MPDHDPNPDGAPAPRGGGSSAEPANPRRLSRDGRAAVVYIGVLSIFAALAAVGDRALWWGALGGAVTTVAWFVLTLRAPDAGSAAVPHRTDDAPGDDDDAR